MPPLRREDESIKQPDADGPGDLHPMRREVSNRKSRTDPHREQNEADENQSAIRHRKIPNGWQVKEYGVQMVRLQLALLHEVHETRHSRQKESPIRDN